MGNNKNWIVDTYFQIRNFLSNFFGGTEFKENKSIVGELINVVTILLFLFAPIGSGILLITSSFHAIPKKVQLWLVIGNLIAVGIWLFMMRFPKLKSHKFGLHKLRLHKLRFHKIKFENEVNKEKYREFLKVEASVDVDKNNIRVNTLVGQLKLWITGYAVCLFIVYGAFLFDNDCVWRTCDSLTETEISSGKLHYYLKIFQDIFNLLSAACLYLAFKVLYNQTLDKITHNPNKYFFDAAFVCLLVIVPYLGYMHSVIYSPQESSLPHTTITKITDITKTYANDINNTAPKSRAEVLNSLISNRNNADSMLEIKRIADNYDREVNIRAAAEMKKAIKEYESDTNDKWSNIFGLIIGSFNGLAMSLLFARYISMEHLINNAKERTFYDWFSTLTVFLLPIYALAQPLFGAFEINAFGDARVFANCVFFICLLGKMFFLYFTYKFIKERKLHYYLHLIITSHDILNNLRDYFVDDLSDEN